VGETPTLPRKWVLVVEDDGQLRALWKQVLQTAGYAVVTTSDGLDAMWIVWDLCPHLIVLDIALPRLSGWELFHVLRANDPLRGTPILLVSTGPDEPPSHPDPTHGLNVVGRLHKGMGAGALLAHVEHALAGQDSLLRPVNLRSILGTREDSQPGDAKNVNRAAGRLPLPRPAPCPGTQADEEQLHPDAPAPRSPASRS